MHSTLLRVWRPFLPPFDNGAPGAALRRLPSPSARQCRNSDRPLGETHRRALLRSIKSASRAKRAVNQNRMLPRQRPIGLLPGIDAALNVAGGLDAGVLRGLYRHRRALAEGAVENKP